MELKPKTITEPASDAKFALIDESRFVRLVMHTPITVQAYVEAGRAAHDHCVARQCDALLWDSRESPGTFSLVDRFDIADECARFWRRQLKVSFLSRPDQVLPERFGQTVAQNRGVQVQVFVDEAAALEWLGVR